jgi:exodeoxyribonuclease-3
MSASAAATGASACRPVKIASWNVNSLKVRLPQVLDWLAEARPDVLALQETKLTNDAFPAAEVTAAGYRVVYSGQKTYNGVAILAREEPRDVVTDIPDLDDPQRRILAATVGDLRVLNLYVVNGQEVGSEKYAYKLDWLARVTAFAAGELVRHPRMVVLGDFNIAPEDRDVHDPEAWRERILCSTPERAALGRMLELGFVDTFRLFEQGEARFSWWDYRAAAFRRNLGLRIDLVLASHALAARCTAATIDTGPRRLERPSDHAPVVAEFTD